ncbi:hypothetical protein [Natrinema sp. SYSU A 869]|uniref:hypothetical protein n=1 Tax=Natrinema sp. SYSU A 869 TaxID=2871694 RepID=UPI001CA4619B|nr:hypothetical protein [Natrinema sp. SYSU A 869]
MNDGVGRRRFLVAAAGAGTIAGCSSSELGESASDETRPPLRRRRSNGYRRRCST